MGSSKSTSSSSTVVVWEFNPSDSLWYQRARSPVKVQQELPSQRTDEKAGVTFSKLVDSVAETNGLPVAVVSDQSHTPGESGAQALSESYIEQKSKLSPVLRTLTRKGNQIKEVRAAGSVDIPF